MLIEIEIIYTSQAITSCHKSQHLHPPTHHHTTYIRKSNPLSIDTSNHSDLTNKMLPPQLTFVTSNANKLSEVRAILGDTIRINNESIDLPELQGTIEDISRDKCRWAAKIVRYPPV